MADQLPVNLARARELKVSQLSEHFANDDVSLEDLEQRIERVYKARSIAELDAITADLRAAPAGISPRQDDALRSAGAPVVPVSVHALPQSRMLSIMSSIRRVGRWAVPRDMSVFALMSDTRLDLTRAELPAGGLVNLQVNAVMASFRIIVPPGMRVINELHSVMSDVGSSADEALVGGGSGPVIRLTGMAMMAEVKVKVRRREEPFEDDD